MLQLGLYQGDAGACLDYLTRLYLDFYVCAVVCQHTALWQLVSLASLCSCSYTLLPTPRQHPLTLLPPCFVSHAVVINSKAGTGSRRSSSHRMRTPALLQQLLVGLLALHAAASTQASSADLVSEALRLHAQSTVLPTHLLDDPELFSGRHLMSDSRKLQDLSSSGRYVLIKNPTMQGKPFC